MQELNTPIKIDLSEINDVHVVYAMQNDMNSRKLIISLTSNNGDDYIIEGDVVARLMGRRPDGKPIYDDCTIIDNTITCVLSNYVLDVYGDANCVIGLYDGNDYVDKDNHGQLLSSIPFTIKIEKNPFDENAILVTPEFSALTNAMTRIDEAVQKGEKLNEDLTELQTDLEVLQDDLTTLKTDTITAKDIAITATQNANTAAEQAIDNATLADTATQNANITITNMNTLKSNVENAEGIRNANENTRISNESERQSYYNAYKILEAYNNSKSYSIGNKVTYQGGTYQCILSSIGNVPTYNTHNTYWKCIAAKGTDGSGGDMFKTYYDINNKQLDVYDYTDDSIANQITTESGSLISKTTAAGGLLVKRIYGKGKQTTLTGKNLAKDVTYTSTTDQYARLCTTTTSFAVGTTVTLSVDTPNTGIYCSIKGAIQTFKTFVCDGTRKTVTFTTELTGNVSIQRETATNATASGLLSNLQIELGSTATAYEPYCGGVPAPNPDYPQEIKSVGGENLFNKDEVYNKAISSSGVIADSTIRLLSGFMIVNSNTQYIAWSGNTNLLIIGYALYDSNGTFIEMKYPTSANSITFTTGSTTKRIRLYFSKTIQTDTISISDASTVMLELGSVKTYYKAYGKYELNIANLGKNFYNMLSAPQQTGIATLTGNSLVSQSMAYPAGFRTDSYSSIVGSGLMLPKGTYKISYTLSTSDGKNLNYLRLGYGEKGATYNYIELPKTIGVQETTITVDTMMNNLFIIAQAGSTSTAQIVTITNFMVRRSADDSTFETYQERKIAISLADQLKQWDYIFCSGAKFYERRYSKMFTVSSGASTYNYTADSTSGYKLVQIQLETFATNTAITLESFGNCFLGVTSPLSELGVNQVYVGTSSGWNGIRATFKISHSVTEVTNAATFVSYLISKGVYVLYKSVNYSDVELDANNTYNLLSLPARNGVTNLFINDSLSPNLEAELPNTTSAGRALSAFCDANRPMYKKAVTLAAGTWTGSAAPYSYIVVDTEINGRDVEVLPATMTDAQAIALNKAMISNPTMDITTNKITLKAYGAKPTINIPIVLAFKGVI